MSIFSDLGARGLRSPMKSGARPEGLRGEGIGVTFDGVTALDGVDICLRDGELVGLIGPNGAGKTTMINVLSGLVSPTTGTLLLDGTEVTGWPSWKLARGGVSRSFQGTRLFAGLSVKDNLEAASLGVGLKRRDARELGRALLASCGLAALADTRTSALSAGDQQRVGVLRVLATRPRYVLLDEPAAGLNELEGEQLVEMIRRVRSEQGSGVLIVEHDMSVIMTLCERIHVLDFGRSIAVGSRAEVRANSAVIDAYLGTGHAGG